MVFGGTMNALTVVSIMAVYFGKFIAEQLKKKMLTRVAVVVFIIMGIVVFF
jgi:putative Ca2+/H+ antiporter (TMEM165/GDT1 family)